MTLPPRARLGLILAVLGGVLAALFIRSGRKPQTAVAGATNYLAMLQRFEEQQAELYWGPELRAQKFGAYIDRLWNRINAASNKLEVLRSVDFPLVLPQFANLVSQELPHGIRVSTPSGNSWRGILDEHTSAGWELEQCEFRHNAFFTNQLGRGIASTYYVSGHLLNRSTTERAIIEGNVMIWWNERPDLPAIREVDARGVKVRTRKGSPAFERVLNDTVTPPAGSYFIDPLIAWDFDRDGVAEIVLAAKNVRYRRASNGVWQVDRFLDHDPGLIFTGILGDFTGNGTTDFLCANFDGLFLYEGAPDGRFPDPSRMVWQASPRLKYAQAITAGDIDGDGDLDLFLGQYKVPYSEGQMPFPYFDANDGHPSFLLSNNGKGDFTDVTASAGLAARRTRRVYSSSLVDLDRDGDLDLAVVSDFAGLEVYYNDGHGHFTDRTKENLSERWAFGMAHNFADFNGDGLLDLLMIGMNSPTADRLASLNLSRPYEVPDADMRTRATYGNRLFFGQRDGSFRQLPLSDAVARTGWSWGVAAADFDNDGFADLYVANGHETRESVQEYEPEFYLHDIYVGKSQENALAQAYFKDKFARTRGRGQSYGGYEKNRFFLNVGGTNFVEAGYLFGLALEQDSRNVAAVDLNGDGKLDLVVTTFEVWPSPRQTLQIFENRLPDTGHWLTVELKPEAALFGAQVEVSNGGSQALATGTSYRTQHPFTVHAGLGRSTNAPAVRIRRIGRPAIELSELKSDHRNHIR